MSAKPRELSAQPRAPSVLADLLESHCVAIVDEFISRARREVTARSLPDETVRDSLVEFLKDLGGQLRELDRPLEPRHNPPAAQHGAQRFESGYDIGGVIREYATLHDVIFDLIVERKSEISVGEYRLFSQFLVAAIADAATTHEKARDEELQRVTSRHIGFLAHELRNPLGSARVALQLLLMQKQCADSRATQSLQRGLDRMADLIDHALMEQRLRVGPEIAPEPIELKQFLEELVVESQFDAEARQQRVELEVSVAHPLKGDPRLLHSAIGNLIRNALKFSKRGGVISLRAREAQGRVIIEIEDECGGLPGGEVNKIFDPFVQTGTDRTGFGLGLAIAKQAVEAHDASIRVHDLPDKGCVFLLDFPAT